MQTVSRSSFTTVTTEGAILPADLLQKVEEYAAKFNVPKNKIIESSLSAYFENLKRAEYIKSFKAASGEKEIKNMAEEDLEDYLKILDEI